MVQVINSVLSRGIVQVAYSVLSVEIDQRSGSGCLQWVVSKG